MNRQEIAKRVAKRLLDKFTIISIPKDVVEWNFETNAVDNMLINPSGWNQFVRGIAKEMNFRITVFDSWYEEFYISPEVKINFGDDYQKASGYVTLVEYFAPKKVYTLSGVLTEMRYET